MISMALPPWPFSPGPAQLGDLEDAVKTDQVGWQDLVLAVVVLVVAFVAAYAVGRAVERWLARPGSQSRAIAALAVRIVRWAIVIIGIALALSLVGLKFGWFTITLAFVAIGLIFVLKPQIESLSSAVALTVRPAFDIGDEIEVQEHVGEVIDITSRSTIIRRRDGRRVHIPNRAMLEETIVVWTTEQARRSTIDFKVREDVDLELVRERVLSAVGSLPSVSAEPAPRLLARGIDGGAVELEVRFWHASRIAEGNAAKDQVARATLGELRRLGVSTDVDTLTVDVRDQAAEPGPDTPGPTD